MGPSPSDSTHSSGFPWVKAASLLHEEGSDENASGSRGKPRMTPVLPYHGLVITRQQSAYIKNTLITGIMNVGPLLS